MQAHCGQQYSLHYLEYIYSLHRYVCVCVCIYLCIYIYIYTHTDIECSSPHDNSVRLEVKRSCTALERMTEINGDSRAQMHAPVRHRQDTENQSYKYRLEVHRRPWCNRLRELFQHLGKLCKMILKIH